MLETLNKPTNSVPCHAWGSIFHQTIDHALKQITVKVLFDLSLITLLWCAVSALTVAVGDWAFSVACRCSSVSQLEDQHLRCTEITSITSFCLHLMCILWSFIIARLIAAENTLSLFFRWKCKTKISGNSPLSKATIIASSTLMQCGDVFWLCTCVCVCVSKELVIIMRGLHSPVKLNWATLPLSFQHELSELLLQNYNPAELKQQMVWTLLMSVYIQSYRKTCQILFNYVLTVYYPAWAAVKRWTLLYLPLYLSIQVRGSHFIKKANRISFANLHSLLCPCVIVAQLNCSFNVCLPRIHC